MRAKPVRFPRLRSFADQAIDQYQRMIMKSVRRLYMISTTILPNCCSLPKLRCAILFLVLLCIAPTAGWTQAKAAKTNAAEFPRPADLPAEALIVHSTAIKGPADRALILWMVSPEKHPREAAAGNYSCPEYSRGSHYAGPTRVSLVNTSTGTIINTVEVKQEYDEGLDSFDVPYAIQKGFYYAVKGNPKKNQEAPADVLRLKDYNGDGKALEFALFDAQACMGLPSTLIGYSQKQDRVIQYPVRLQVDDNGKTSSETSHWCDYLFDKDPRSPGRWKYQVDYRGRGGVMVEYEVQYNAAEEAFEGKQKITGEPESASEEES